jgi:hypothetical protein
VELTPEQRALRSRLGGLSTAARGHVNTAPARAAFASRFYADLPDDLAPAERERRAEANKRLYYARLAYKSVRSRSKKKAGPADIGPASEVRRATDEPSAA